MAESTPSDTTTGDTQRLRRVLSDAEQRLAALERSALHGAILLTELVLVAGLIPPFFVPRSGSRSSATLWEALTDDAPAVVPDGGAFWSFPIVATVIVMIAVFAFWNGAGPGAWRTAGRTLAVAYLAGCLIGFAVLGAYDEVPSLTAVSPSLIVLTVGAALAVGIALSPIPEQVHRAEAR